MKHWTFACWRQNIIPPYCTIVNGLFREKVLEFFAAILIHLYETWWDHCRDTATFIKTNETTFANELRIHEICQWELSYLMYCLACTAIYYFDRIFGHLPLYMLNSFWCNIDVWEIRGEQLCRGGNICFELRGMRVFPPASLVLKSAHFNCGSLLLWLCT